MGDNGELIADAEYGADQGGPWPQVHVFSQVLEGHVVLHKRIFARTVVTGSQLQHSGHLELHLLHRQPGYFRALG